MLLEDSEDKESRDECDKIDKLQEDETPFVILQSISLDKEESDLHFLKNLERLFVALSRAQAGFLIVGSHEMADMKSHLASIKA